MLRYIYGLGIGIGIANTFDFSIGIANTQNFQYFGTSSANVPLALLTGEFFSLKKIFRLG